MLASAYVSARTSGLIIRLAESASPFPHTKQIAATRTVVQGWEGRLELVSCDAKLVVAFTRSRFDCGGWPCGRAIRPIFLVSVYSMGMLRQGITASPVKVFRLSSQLQAWPLRQIA